MLIKGQADIEIQISELGYITIKQDDDAVGPQVISFAPAFASKIAQAITALEDFAQKKFEKYEPEEV